MSKAKCRMPQDLSFERCGTIKGITLCIGDRVRRVLTKNIPKEFQTGVVMGVHAGADNRGRKQLAARVCFDGDGPGDLAYPYLFSELKPIKK